MRDFIRQTGQDRNYFQEQNYDKVDYTKNTQNSLTSPSDSGKLNITIPNVDFTIKKLDKEAITFYKKYIMQYKEKFRGYTKALTYRFNNGSENAKKIFLKYVPEDSIENCNLNIKEDPHFNSNTGKINMNFIVDFGNKGGKKGVGSIYFHEYGHLIDHALGDISIKSPKFQKSLNIDYMNFITQINIAGREKYSYKQIYMIAAKQLQNLRTDNGVSDIIHGLSNKMIKGCTWHDKKKDGSNYWNDNTICQEAFAHMFEAQFDKLKYEKMKSVFPNAFQEFESMLEDYI